MHRILLACLPTAVLCLLAWQSVAALSGCTRSALEPVTQHIWKHNTASAKHLDSFPAKGKKKDLHLSQRFKYKAKTFCGANGTGSVHAEKTAIANVPAVVLLYSSPLVRPGYYTFLFRYKPF